MSAMGNYVMYVGERLQKKYPQKTWDEIMEELFAGKYGKHPYLRAYRKYLDKDDITYNYGRA